MLPFVAFLAFQDGAVDPSKDPAYAKPVTVALPLTPLRTIVAELSKASGQSLSAAGVLLDWKATLLVKDLPAGVAMEALADTLGLVWKPSSGGLILVRPDGSASLESAYLKEESAKAESAPGVAVESPAIAGAASPVTIVNGQGGARRIIRRPLPEAGKGVFSRYSPYLLSFEIGGMNPQYPTRLEPSRTVGESPFAKAVREWPKLPATPDPAWMKTVAGGMPKPTWLSKEVALSDLLVAWHAASGLPVVADAFRVPIRSGSIQPGPALTGLQTMATAERMSLKLANGVARLRHPAFWRLREQEIPESAWISIERSRPNLATMASFARRLTAAQIASFRSQEPPLSTVATEPIREAYPGLLLWNTLNRDAQNALMAGRPIALAQIPTAKSSYEYALREAPYYGAGDPTAMLAANPNQVGLFATRTEKAIELRLAGETGTGGVAYLLPL